MPLRLLSELALPEYRDRHLFTARLRLAIFFGFWCLYLYFYHGVFGQLQTVTFIVAGSFLLTTLSYFWILKNRFVFLSVVTEIVADLIAITTVIYITEGPYSDFFTIYLFYIFIAGIFYNYMLALFIAAGCAVFYGAFLMLCQYGFIPPLIIDWGEKIPIESHSPGYHFFFWVLFAVLVVYGVRVASHFSQKRERMLEIRNKELTALAQMSSTIRSTISIEKVLQQVLHGLQEGLDLELPLLILIDREQNRLKALAPQNAGVLKKIEKILGRDLSEFSFPLDVEENSALKAILNHQIFFRRRLGEVVVGLHPPLRPEQTAAIEKAIGFKKLVGVPLVAESELLGCVLGFTRSGYVEEQTVKTLEAFGNQAALILEAALLIQKLREANENLQEANRVKSEFLATMSHELRTPLTAIIGFSELLLEGVMGRLTDEQSESLREVLNNGAILLDMINNLLDMAKVEAGKMTLEPYAFDLCEMLKRLKQTISSLIHRKDQTLLLHLPDSAPLIHADEKKVQQILLNLIANAIKFTPEKGKISVSLKHHPEEKTFEMSVEDNGIGIQKEKLETVFDMFSQVDSSVTRTHGGTGLGLALAKQFTELHQGKIWVESEYGKGTKFTVILPEAVVI